MRGLLARAVQFILSSRRRVWSAVICAAVLFGFFEFAVDRWFIRVDLRPDLHAALQACIVGIGAGVVLWFLLLGMIERRNILADELRRVAELNHAVRNSLELIVLANYSDEDRERRTIVLDSTKRIDQKLRELFPVIGRRGAHETAIKVSETGRRSDESPDSARAPGQ